MKMDFNTGGTWRQVGQLTLMMKIYDFFYSTKLFSHPVKYCVKNLPSSQRFLNNIIQGD